MTEFIDTNPPFVGFPKMARLSRECIVTEKLDGTNAQIKITEDGDLFAGSRTRWLSAGNDNFGFARWAQDHVRELLELGPGSHFGEWWGHGIQRGYGLKERRFSLFNASRWCEVGKTPEPIKIAGTRPNSWLVTYQKFAPACCHVVPVLFRGEFNTCNVQFEISRLGIFGSAAAPGYQNPEGVVVYHIAAGVSFKKTLHNDKQPKTKTP